MTDTPETDELSKGEHIAHPTVWSFCRKFERERNDAIEMMKRTKNNSGEIIASQVVENIILTQERDRLAEALQKVVTSWDDAAWLDNHDFEAFREVLRSLNQPTEP